VMVADPTDAGSKDLNPARAIAGIKKLMLE
jgi:hypothetical protein